MARLSLGLNSKGDDIHRMIDEVAHSENGNKFSAAWNDGDEETAELIIRRTIDDDDTVYTILDHMFEGW